MCQWLNVVGQVIQRAEMVCGVGHMSNFTARNINAIGHYVESLPHQLKQRQAMIVDRVDG
jgi:hypothetical protein